MAEGRWGKRGGILTLLDLIEQHRPAFEYDWRHHFHIPLSDVPDGMDWAEAWRMTRLLAADPSTRIAASLLDWDLPRSLEWMALADLFDSSERNRVRKKAKPYPRPWDRAKTRFGRAVRSQAEIRRALAARGHDI